MAMLPDPHMQSGDASNEHPAGFVRLAIDDETRRPLDLKLPDELATHVFLPGASGSGQTRTLTRLGDGALANWYGLVMLSSRKIVQAPAEPLGLGPVVVGLAA
jgi:hypothetical protein